MGLGQPDVQRNEAGLGAEADHGQRGRRTAAAVRRRRPKPAEVQSSGVPRPAAGTAPAERPCRGAWRPGRSSRPGGRLGLLVLEHHQEERRQRHEFPGHEEQHAVARDHDDQHAGGQEIEEEPGRPQGPARGVGLQVGDPVHGGQAAHQRGHRGEEGRQPVEADVKGPERQRPGQAQVGHPAGEGGLRRDDQGSRQRRWHRPKPREPRPRVAARPSTRPRRPRP